MFSEHPTIRTHIEAVDKVDDVRETIEGLSTFALALEISDVSDCYSLRLMAKILGYCGMTLQAARPHLATYGAHPFKVEVPQEATGSTI